MLTAGRRFVREQEGVNTNQVPGKNRTDAGASESANLFIQPVLLETLHWVHTVDGQLARSIAVSIGNRWARFTIYCGGRCVSMDSLHWVLRPARAIEGYGSQCFVVDNAYRSKVLPSFQVGLLRAICIVRHAPQSVVADNGYR